MDLLLRVIVLFCCPFHSPIRQEMIETNHMNFRYVVLPIHSQKYG